MNRWLAIVTILLTGAVCSSTAFSYELYEAPWEAGEPGWEGGDSTYVAYDFTLGSNEAVIGNDFGTPEMTVTNGFYTQKEVTGPDGINLINAWFINAGGSMSFKVPNSDRCRERKAVLLQFTSSYPSNNPTSDPAGTFVPNSYLDIIHENGWLTRVDYFEIRPNPNEETFTYQFSTGAYVSEATISTICIPEPCSVVLLAGLLATAGFRRSNPGQALASTGN